MIKSIILIFFITFSSFANDTNTIVNDSESLRAVKAYAYEVNQQQEFMEASETINYVRQAETLLNLPGVYVFTDYIFAVNSSEPVDKNLPFLIEEKLRKAGITIFSKEEVEKVNGNPEIQFYLSATESGQSCCLSIWMSLLQGASLIRDTRLAKKMGTWGAGEGNDCSLGRVTGDVSSMVLRQVDKFITDYKTTNKHLYELKTKITGQYSNAVYINSTEDVHEFSVEILKAKDGDFVIVKKHINNQTLIPVVVPVIIDGLDINFIISSLTNNKEMEGYYHGRISQMGLTLTYSKLGEEIFLPRLQHNR